MEVYRLYFTTRRGHIEHFREFAAETDAEAIDVAAGWHTGQSMELWLRERKVSEWRNEPEDWL